MRNPIFSRFWLILKYLCNCNNDVHVLSKCVVTLGFKKKKTHPDGLTSLYLKSIQNSFSNTELQKLKRIKWNRICYPQMCHFGMQIILSWRQSRPRRHKKNFYLFYNCLKEFRWGTGPERELLPEITFHLKDQRDRVNIWLPNSCFSYLPVNCPPPILKAQALIPFP